MIFGLIGEGGSGKSAIAVSIALDHLKQYDIIYTNIEDFNKNDSVVDIASNLNTDIDIRHFDNDSEAFLDVLRDIEVIQADNDVDEKFKILILYDECHKSLRRFTSSKDEDVYISDFLSEHRHYHTDFYFLTQGYKKIADMYKGEFKAWYLSVDDQFKSDPDHILFKKMDKDCKIKIGVKRFKKSLKWRGKSGNLYKVFDCYNSGDNGEKQINLGLSMFAKKKYAFIAILLFVVGAIFYSYTSVSSMFGKKLTKTSSNVSSKTSLKVVSSSVDNSVSPDDINFSDKLIALTSIKDKTSIVGNFKIIKCLFDVKRKLYIFDNRILTKNNFDSLNDYFVFKLVTVQIVSENFFKFSYLVNSDIASVLDSSSVSKKTKSMKFHK